MRGALVNLLERVTVGTQSTLPSSNVSNVRRAFLEKGEIGPLSAFAPCAHGHIDALDALHVCNSDDVLLQHGKVAPVGGDERANGDTGAQPMFRSGPRQ